MSDTTRFAERLADQLNCDDGPPLTGPELARIIRYVLKATPPAAGEGRWPDAVSDGLLLPCHDCGQVPRFDYRVDDDFWQRHVPGAERTSVVCLPCLDRRCGGVGLADAIIEIQWTGTGHTVVCKPWLRHKYRQRAQSGEG